MNVDLVDKTATSGYTEALRFVPTTAWTEPPSWTDLPSAESAFGYAADVAVQTEKREEAKVFFLDDWAGTGDPAPPELRSRTGYPDPKVMRSAEHLLSDRVNDTLDRLLPLLRRHAQANGVSVGEVQIKGLVDREEDLEEIVVTQSVSLDPRQALAYWDQLGARMEVWSELLPEYVAQTLADHITVRVWWEATEDAL